MSGILRLESLTKGNTLKQGDKTPLKYRLFDADGEKINIAGKTAKVRLVYPDFLTIGYEKDGLTVAQDDTVTFTIDKVIPAKLYHVEIIVDDKFIFPSRSDESKFTVDKSSLGTETNIIEIVGVDAVVRKAVDLINKDPNLIIDEDKLVGDIISNTGIGSIEEYHQQFNDVIKELSEEKDYHSLPEIAGARRGYTTLGESLQNLSVSMLNPNLGKLTQVHLSDELLAQIAGDAAVNAVPADGSLTTAKYADKSVTLDKTNFINSSVNLFNKNTAHKQIGGYYAGGDFVERADFDTYFVRVKPEMVITTNTTPVNNISFWDESFNYLTFVSYSQTMSVPDNINIAWVSLPVSTSLNVDEVMVVEGESLPETYIPYLHTLSDYIGVSSGALDPLVDKDIVSKNIFNKDTVRIGYEVNGINLQVQVQGDSAVSANINVEGMSSVYISGLPTYNIGGSKSLGRDRYYAFYDVNGVPITGSLGLIPRSVTGQSIDVPDNAKELVFTIYQRKTTPEPVDVSKIMVEERRTKSRFEPYEFGMVGIAGYRFETGTPDENLPTEGKVGLFFGDSITQTAVVSDSGAEYDEARRSNWPNFAYGMLKLGGMWNYAQSGASFKDRSLQPRQYLGHQVDTAISNDRPADIIVVSCGTNDGAEAIGDYDIAMSKSSLSELDTTNLYESIRYSFWKLRTHYPDATMYAALPIQRVAREQPEELIEAITKMAHRYNFIIIDGLRESGIVRDFEVSGGNGRYLEDGLHPNVDGQIKMAKLYSRVIKNTYTP